MIKILCKQNLYICLPAIYTSSIYTYTTQHANNLHFQQEFPEFTGTLCQHIKHMQTKANNTKSNLSKGKKKNIVKTIIIHFLSCEIKIQISWFTCVNSVCERCETQYTQVLQYCISLNHTKPEEHHCFGIQILKTQNIIHLMRLQRWKRSLWVGFTVYTNQYTVRAKRYMQIM